MNIKQMIATYPVLSNKPTLLANINDWIGVHIKTYVDPTQETLDNTWNLVKGLVEKDADAINNAVAHLGLTPYRIEGKPLGVMYRHPKIFMFPVLLYWDFSDDALPVFIEDPHNLQDLMFRLTARLQGNNQLFSPRGMISNAVAPKAAAARAPGQPSRSASDAAHSWWCLFRRISTWVAKLHEFKIPHIQIHGYKGGDYSMVLLHNQFNAQFNPKYKNINVEMAKAFAEVFPISECNKMALATKKMEGSKDGIPYVVTNFEPGKAWFKTGIKGINTCVEARGINGGGTRSVGVEDRGLFVHVELRTARFGQANNLARMDRFYKVVEIAVNNFINSPLPSPVVSSGEEE